MVGRTRREQRRRAVGRVLLALGPMGGMVAAALALRTAVESAAGVAVPAIPLVLAAAVLGLFAAPRIRPYLEGLGTESGGALLAVAVPSIATIVTVLGMALLVPAVGVTCAIYGVLITPSRRRVQQALALTLVTSVLAIVAQQQGWVGGLVGWRTAAVTAAALLLLVGPTVANVASLSGRALTAARELEDERLRHVQDLQHLAVHDPLTGLLNRAGLTGLVAAAAAGADRRSGTAILFVDLDGFKGVNDTFGHAVGDALLVHCAAQLRMCLRGPETVARVGGDEFVVLLTDLTDAATAADVASRVERALAVPTPLGAGAVVQVGASVGVALTWEPVDPAVLLARADTAMYERKRARDPRAAATVRPAPGRERAGVTDR